MTDPKTETTHPAQEADPLPVLQITNWPLRDDPWQAVAAATGIVVVSAAVAWFVGNRWIGLAIVPALAFTLWRMWVPVRFELDFRGIQQVCFRRHSFIPWSGVARYEVDPAGVLLLNQRDAFPISAFHGLYIAAHGNHTQLVQLIQYYTDSA